MKITVIKREKQQKQAKQLLATGFIPAVVYGPKRESLNVKVDEKEFNKVFKQAGYSKIVEFGVDGKKDEGKALIREVQVDPVTEAPVHVAFYELDLTKAITAEIPVVAKGASQAVVNSIGFLVTPNDKLAVRCLPGKLPSEIVIDISSLDAIGDSISVSDLDLPEGVEFDTDVSETMTLAYIAPPQKEIVEEAPEEELEEGEEVEGEEGVEGEEDETPAEGEGEKEEGAEEGEEKNK